MPALPRILYCHCAFAQIVDHGLRAEVLQRLEAAGVAFEAVADLCELSARQDPRLKALVAGQPMQIIACHARAVRWLLAVAQAQLDGQQSQLLNLRGQSAAEIAGAVLSPNGAGGCADVVPVAAAHPPGQSPRLFLLPKSTGGAAAPGGQTGPERLGVLTLLLDKGYTVSCLGAAGASPHGLPGETDLLLGWGENGSLTPPAWIRDFASDRVLDLSRLQEAELLETVEARLQALGAGKPGGWFPWFPVIDFDRCTQCMQCLSFCLFGVFGVNGRHQIEVQHAESCKTNCPACSRVCPEAAILFPKHEAGPINGEAIPDAGAAAHRPKVDISALLGGDVYQALRRRNDQARNRFSKERDPQQALEERQKCLAGLGALDQIPPEVLLALPSPEEIHRRAAQAKAKAALALENQRRAMPPLASA